MKSVIFDMDGVNVVYTLKLNTKSVSFHRRGKK